VELDQEQRGLRQGQLRVAVAGRDLHLVEELDARDRDAGLNRQDGGVAGRLDRGERADARRDRLGDAVQAQRDLGDDPEGALRADEEPGEIVAGGRLARPPGGRDDVAVRHHRGEREHRVLHRPVAHGVGARRPRRRHPADRGVRPGIDGEEQAGIAQVRVQSPAGDAGLDRAVEVIGIDRADTIHRARVDRDAAERRVDVALEGGADAVGHDRHVALGAGAHDGLHLRGGVREDHEVRRLARRPR
jgi:hypothetical protein